MADRKIDSHGRDTNAQSERVPPRNIDPSADASADGRLQEGDQDMNMHASIKPAAETSPAPSPAPVASMDWDTAKADYEAKLAHSNSLDASHPEADEAVEQYCAAQDRLIEDIPAPSLDHVIAKFEMAQVRCEGFGFFESYARAILADLHRLRNESVLIEMAVAWIDRWRALGGTFGMVYEPDGSPRTVHRGIPMSYTWNPPTFAEAQAQSPDLRPHEMILDRRDFDGAHKMLESFLSLVPGLRDAVFNIAEILVATGRGYAGSDHIAYYLAYHRAANAGLTGDSQ